MAKEKKDDKFDPRQLGKIVDSITGLGKISKKEGKKIKKNLGLVGDAIKQLPAEGEIKVQLDGVGNLVDSMVKLGESSKKHAKKSAKNLDLIRDSVGKFAKGLKGKDITNVTDSFEEFADGIVKLGNVGWRQKKRITGTLDAVGISLKKFSNNEGVITSADGLESMADSITKLSLIGRRKRKGIVKDLTEIGAAFGLSAGAVGKGGSALALKEKTKEAAKAKGKAQEKRLNMFSMLGGKLDDLIELAPKKEKKGFLEGIKGMFGGGGLKGLLGLGTAGIKGLFGLATSPIGLAIGAAVGGFMLGGKIFEKWLGPLMDKAFEKGTENWNEAVKFTQEDAFMTDASGKQQQLYKTSEGTLAAPAAEALAKEKGFESLEAAMATPDSGFSKKKISMSSGGQAIGAMAETEEELAALQEAERGNVALKSVAGGRGGESESEKTAAQAKIKMMNLAGSILFDERQLFSVMSKKYPDEAAAQDAEDGVQIAAEGIYGNYLRAIKQTENPSFGLSKDQVDTLYKQFPLVWSTAWPGKSFGGLYKEGGPEDNEVHAKIRGRWGWWNDSEYLKEFGKPGSLFDGEAVMPGYSDLPGGVLTMAKGGLVQRPTRALVGEAGPEAVVPLEKAPQFIANVLAKTINTLGNQQVGMQNALSTLSSAVGGSSPVPAVTTNVITSSNNNAYHSTNMSPRNVNGIQYKISSRKGY